MRPGLDQLEARTQAFASDCLDLGALVDAVTGMRVVGQQLARAALSVGANHRAMRRARSLREFAAKLQVVNEEADECVYWLELVTRRPTAPPTAQALLQEACELRAIFAKARATTRVKLASRSHGG